jgi:hypothetical protein
MDHSGSAALLVGVALVTGWRLPEVVRRLRWLGQGVTK